MKKAWNLLSLAIKTTERHHGRRSGVFIVNFEHVSFFPTVSVVDFEQISVYWVDFYTANKPNNLYHQIRLTECNIYVSKTKFLVQLAWFAFCLVWLPGNILNDTQSLSLIHSQSLSHCKLLCRVNSFQTFSFLLFEVWFYLWKVSSNLL